MNNFTPYEKLSKKERRKRNAEKRTVWTISPVTRRPANPKAYNRKKAQKWRDDSSVSVFFCILCRIYDLINSRMNDRISR